MKPQAGLLNDWLQELSVPHTRQYTSERFTQMPFQSLFGLGKLLQEYGIESEVLKLGDRSELVRLSPPFLADTPQGLVIVTQLTDVSVTYLTQGERETVSRSVFNQAWNGIVMLAFPGKDAREPDYTEHHLVALADKAKGVILIAVAVGLFLYAFIVNKLYWHATTILLTVFDLVGLYFSFLLMQKTLNIHSRTADRVCGALEKGGCDSILETKASSFFGIVKWSEVGFAYFSVSLLTLLMFPQTIGWLALINICCLPFTVWSITYQKFIAKHWCTMCVSVQATLWALFVCYLTGGWTAKGFPLGWGFFVLIAVYVLATLSLNRLTPHLTQHES